jgi:predicted AAA+ superfamily ATPase
MGKALVERIISPEVLRLATQYPVVTITGPRQSGKTTLCKMIFPNKKYVSLEDIENREFADSDPRGFIERFQKGAIIDEIQRVPQLLSYIQTYVDSLNKEGIFIITGSQNLQLLEGISQSLAGRTALVTLLPFSYSEAWATKKKSLDEVLFTGFYPRIFDKKLNPSEALSFYVSTYLEKDVRQIISIKHQKQFNMFLKLCAGRTAQILNMSSLANDCGVNHKTIRSWLNVLELSYIIKLIQPYYQNFNKRLTKSPKLHFLDSGLACYLLGIQSAEQLNTHPVRGSIFESYAVSEILKSFYNRIMDGNIYYFRDNVGNEVDIITERGSKINVIEVKSSMTVSKNFFKNLYYIKKISGIVDKSGVIYGGNENYQREGFDVISWRHLSLES